MSSSETLVTEVMDVHNRKLKVLLIKSADLRGRKQNLSSFIDISVILNLVVSIKSKPENYFNELDSFDDQEYSLKSMSSVEEKSCQEKEDEVIDFN